MTVYVVHGYMAAPQSNWFPWLVEQCQYHNINIHVLEMPNSHFPDKEIWNDKLTNEIQLDSDTIVVGHSLGCITLLRYLAQQHTSTSIKGAILVSGFFEAVGGLPELDTFTQESVNFSDLIHRIQHRVVITARNDDIVPHHYSERLAEKLSADFLLYQEGGHFIDRDGIRTLPAVLEKILKFSAD